MSETVTVGIVQTSADVVKKLLEGVIEFRLILGRLRAQQMTFVLVETVLICQHEAQHGSHHCPVILRRTVKKQVEESRGQARKKTRVGSDVLRKEEVMSRCILSENQETHLVQIVDLRFVLSVVREVVRCDVVNGVCAMRADGWVAGLQTFVYS